MLKIIILIGLFTLNGWSQTVLPTNLTSAEQEDFLHLFGVQTTAKLLTNPYPLGGYDGFDIGVSITSVSLKDFDTTNLKSEKLPYASFSIAKGLFNDVDIYFNFVPPLRQNNISNYSVLVKWSFNEGMFLPVVWSLSAHTGATNAADQFTSKSTGFELSGGYSFNRLSIYGGVGFVTSAGRFIGNKNGVNFTLSGADETNALSSNHLFIGGFYQVRRYYAAFQIDQYNELITTSKVGIRF